VGQCKWLPSQETIYLPFMLTAPDTEFEDYYENARFKLTWNINLSLVIGLFIMSVLFVLFEPRFVIHYGIGFLMAAGGLIYLKKTLKYRGVALFLTIFGFLLVVSSVFLVQGALHYIEPLWMLNISFYAYFTLGRKWGNTFLIFTIISTAVYFSTSFSNNILIFEELSLGQSLSMGGETAISVLIIGYIVHQFLSTMAYAEGKYRNSNAELMEEKRNAELQNQEKTLLLQEIHHRVKNNLQVITSLLRIQASKLDSEEARSNFQDAINRIMTMSLIHQKMYERENLSEIELHDYFDSLLNDLIRSSMHEDAVKTDVLIGVKSVGAKSIVPLALIITELVTNSLKHAFENGNEKLIQLKINATEDPDEFDLIYYDSGKWKNAERSDSFGLSLVETFTEQLEGSFKRELRDHGTYYHFKLTKIDRL
jgi:two-component sensor histidine kinase